MLPLFTQEVIATVGEATSTMIHANDELQVISCRLRRRQRVAKLGRD